MSLFSKGVHYLACNVGLTFHSCRVKLTRFPALPEDHCLRKHRLLPSLLQFQWSPCSELQSSRKMYKGVDLFLSSQLTFIDPSHNRNGSRKYSISFIVTMGNVGTAKHTRKVDIACLVLFPVHPSITSPTMYSIQLTWHCSYTYPIDLQLKWGHIKLARRRLRIWKLRYRPLHFTGTGVTSEVRPKGESTFCLQGIYCCICSKYRAVIFPHDICSMWGLEGTLRPIDWMMNYQMLRSTVTNNKVGQLKFT